MSVDKLALNKTLKINMKLVCSTAIDKSGLIEAQWVQVKEQRMCRDCKHIVPKGEIALTGSFRNRQNQKIRTYICGCCSSNAINKMFEIDELIENAIKSIIYYEK